MLVRTDRIIIYLLIATDRSDWYNFLQHLSLLQGQRSEETLFPNSPQLLDTLLLVNAVQSNDRQGH